MRQNVNHLYNVYLRTWDQDDIEGYAELLGDPQTMQYISAGTTRNRDTAAAEIARFQQEIAQQGWSRWAVSLGLDSPFIGYAGFAEKEYGINFGNRFLKKYWGSPLSLHGYSSGLGAWFPETGLRSDLHPDQHQASPRPGDEPRLSAFAGNQRDCHGNTLRPAFESRPDP
ncbi:GNAT family N-acetyltransferase [Pseudomonas sp. FP833]|uniref:GNAT family N-acetyltransferase n=1 Tax=Pseudomonas sp. FP833 TaxID=2954102 RepID=UPI00351ECAB6